VRLAAHALQPDLLSERRLRVVVRARRAGAVEVGAELVRGDTALPLAEPSVVRVGARRAARAILPLAEGAEAALTACEPAQLRLRARGRGLDAPVAERTVPLRLAPPRCGRFFAADAVWNEPLPTDAPLDPSSDRLSAALREQVRANFDDHYGPNINTESYSAPIYTVPASQRRVPVEVAQRGPHTRELRAAWRAVPIPAGASPAEGTDRHLVVWQPATDTMWEFFDLRRDHGRWSAEWGGRMLRVSRSRGWFRPTRTGVRWGATATGLPLAGGLMTVAELQRGRIDHALAFAIPRARSGVWSWPAQRTDGELPGAGAIPEGARFRLDPSLDVAALRLPPLVHMMAEAVQRYGMVLRDQAGVVAFYGEDPKAAGANPYQELLPGVSVSEALRRFPWDRLQLVRMDLRTADG
jgi:hypothetical protein